MNRISRLLALPLAGAAAALGLALPAQAETSNPGLPHGIDVSSFDQGIDWRSGDLAFGIAKATEGRTLDDPGFAQNWKELGQYGKVRGAYHYAHPDNDPVQEADHFVRVVQQQGLKDGDLLMLDLEDSDGRSTQAVNAWAKTWLERVTQQTGVKPFFYSSWSFAQQYGAGLGDYPLWVAHYGEDAGQVTPPAPWTSWTLHQYASTDHDHNVSRLSTDQLKALGYHQR
ncbi:glycoside hydrolase family 25 protein [Actinomadura rupiterrae]|uniref:glycoside hydrolase family 25 protein n=1 Tax=Actinomadura rupiterrae TaxID=559627 RepID=UPI0020A255D6|nr:glycoside hydrolase family 25 protein [Actinomadura rupiterrae]MCP2336056.1 GH25 family lysozyme M1 (1,4-beta-N-acetylmuramidase) [Actinomadura rupiterrae]